MRAQPTPGWRPSRREFLGAAGLAFLAAACTGGPKEIPSPTLSSGPPAQPGSIAELEGGAARLSMISTASADNPVNPGVNRFGFDLSTPKNEIVTGGSPQVWVAQDQTTRALGPFAATWQPFTGVQATGDQTANVSGLPGTYVAQIDVPQVGIWLVTATVVTPTGKGTADPNALTVVAQPVVAALGSKATSTPTPVATTDAGLAQICTRKPPCHMHAISLDAALKNGKPTVVVFATPLLCESQLCEPVTDEVIVASQQLGSKVNFIHVEEFLPGPSLQPPAPTLENQAPAFKVWQLESEPWVFVIDALGVIRFRADGPCTAPEIEAAAQALL